VPQGGPLPAVATLRLRNIAQSPAGRGLI